MHSHRRGWVVNPIEVLEALGEDVLRLDTLDKLLDEATNALDEAEAIWDEKYDAVAESLKEDMVTEGRKGDPAEHTIVATTRRQNRVSYQNLRRAKRAVDKAEKQIAAKRSAMNGRQSLLNSTRDEAKAPPYQPHMRRAA